MNATSESQLEAGRMKSILSTITQNLDRLLECPYLYKAGKRAQVVREMKNNKLHVLGLS